MIGRLINFGLLIFLTITSIYVFFYTSLLWEKIIRPQFKNMDWPTAAWGGLIAVIVIVIDIMILRRFLLDKKKRRIRS